VPEKTIYCALEELIDTKMNMSMVTDMNTNEYTKILDTFFCSFNSLLLISPESTPLSSNQQQSTASHQNTSSFVLKLIFNFRRMCRAFLSFIVVDVCFGNRGYWHWILNTHRILIWLVFIPSGVFYFLICLQIFDAEPRKH
jgi:hypothetical protein